MKKHIIALLFIPLISLSQTIKVDYVENRIISKERLEQIPEFAREEALKKKYYTLINSNGVSLYSFVDSDKIDTLKTSIKEDVDDDKTQITTSIYKVSTNKIEDFYYKDFTSKTMIFKMFNDGKNFDGKDKMVEWNWTIENETQLINDFICKKATCYNSGVTFTAWFTEDLPISDGPDKFWGLPGLILKVSNPFYERVAKKVVVEKENTIFEKPKECLKTYTIKEITDYLSGSIPKSGTITKTQGNTTTTTTTTIIKD